MAIAALQLRHELWTILLEREVQVGFLARFLKARGINELLIEARDRTYDTEVRDVDETTGNTQTSSIMSGNQVECSDTEMSQHTAASICPFPPDVLTWISEALPSAPVYTGLLSL